MSWVAIGLAVLLAASVAGLLPYQIMRVSSNSMSPTIDTGDLVVVERMNDTVHRMDVIAVQDPGGDGLLVKRAVALGGDSVGLEDGVLVVNGSPVCEPLDPELIDGEYFGPFTVPEDEIFLLGDERDSSIDSRQFGPVAASHVVGLVRVRLWPGPDSLVPERC